MIRRIWHDPVWSKVIAAAIIAVFGSLGAYFAGYLGKIGIIVTYAWRFLAGKTPLYNWLIVVLSIPAIIMLILVVAFFKGSKARENVPYSLDFRNYNSGTFFGLTWRWRLGSDGAPYEITPFCPKCDYQIVPKFASAFRVAPRYALMCEDCGFDGGFIEGEYRDFEQKIVLKIQQNLRT